MRRLGIALLFLLAVAAADAATPPRIVVSRNGRFLQTEDGKPFFWLADTAWLLFRHLDRAETERYLEDRRSKGFTVIQASIIHSAGMRNQNGPLAYLDKDPSKLNLEPKGNYWEHIDWVVDLAAQKGLYIAFVPCWGSLVRNGTFNERNMGGYADFVARRYRDKPNVFWIVGGDTPADQNVDVWRILGSTLRKEDPNHLITFHPFGRTNSADSRHGEPWLDFDMFQSGHQRYDQDTKSPHKYGEDNWRYVADALKKSPPKPVIDGEPSYEGIPQGLHDTTQPYWTDADVRRYAYWSVFAGAMGHTYGNNAIMQFWSPQRGGRGAFGPKESWMDALNDPGAGQMRYLAQLILSRPYFDRVADQSAVAGAPGTRYDRVAVTRGRNYLLAYTYTGKPFELKLAAISGAEVRARWHNPRDGVVTEAGTFRNRGTRRFSPPEGGKDWVLALDDTTAGFAAPGR